MKKSEKTKSSIGNTKAGNAVQEPAESFMAPPVRVVSECRMEEIATKVLHALVEDDPIEAAVFFEDELELTTEEREFFGLDTMRLF